jgi:hypothetical protein
MPTLRPFLDFDPVETPLSFATRLATLHTGGPRGPFLNDIGIQVADLAGGDPRAVDRLSAVAGVDPAVVRHNTPLRIARRRHDLRREIVSSEFFSSPNTVFCPACLRDDDTARTEHGGRRGRLAWTLRPVRTCLVHEIALMQRAPDRWDDRYHDMNLRVPERADALDDLVARSERRPVSPLQAYVTARLDGHPGPAWLDSQTLAQAVRATEMLGVLVAFGPRTALRSLTEADWDRAGRVGYPFTAAGEDGIRTALEDVRKAADGNRKPGRLAVFGCLYSWLGSRKPQPDPGDIKRILRTHIFATMAVGADETVLGEALGRRRLHSVESLAREADLDPRTLRNVLVARGLVPKADQGSPYHAFDADAGRAVAAQVRRSVHVIALPAALNCSRPQASQLIDERLLSPLCDEVAHAPGRTRKTVDATEIEALPEKLRGLSRPVSAVPDGLVPIAKAAERAKAGSGEIMQMILAGFLKTVVRHDGIAGYAGLFVDPAEVRKGMGKFMPGLSPTRALGMLGIPMSAMWALADRDMDPCLRRRDILGPTGHRFSRFCPQDIAVFLARFRTVAHIATTLDRPYLEIERRLKADGVRPVPESSEIGLDLYLVETLPDWCVP